MTLDPGRKNSEPRSRINIPDPQHCSKAQDSRQGKNPKFMSSGSEYVSAIGSGIRGRVDQQQWPAVLTYKKLENFDQIQLIHAEKGVRLAVTARNI